MKRERFFQAAALITFLTLPQGDPGENPPPDTPIEPSYVWEIPFQYPPWQAEYFEPQEELPEERTFTLEENLQTFSEKDLQILLILMKLFPI